MGVTRRTLWLVTGGCFTFCYPAFLMAIYPEWMGDNKTKYPEKTVIITGASGNMGVAMTRAYAFRQCRVIMACRDMDKCKSYRRELVLETKNKSIVCRHLDLEDIDSINSFVEKICETEPHIDVLVNNAAIKKTKTKEVTKYGVERMFWVNFIAPYLLTLKLLPKLKESAEVTRDSRIINVTGTPRGSWKIDFSDINFDKRKFDSKSAYRQSKLALAYFTILLEKINRDQGSRIFVFGTSPDTRLIRPVYSHMVTEWEEIKYQAKYLFFIDPYRMVEPALRCGVDRKLIDNGGSGKLYTYIVTWWGRNGGWGPHVKDETKAKVIWNYAADLLLGITDEPVKKLDAPAEVGQDNLDNQAQAGDQVKLQANSKASGVDESA